MRWTQTPSGSVVDAVAAATKHCRHSIASGSSWNWSSWSRRRETRSTPRAGPALGALLSFSSY